MRRRRAGFEMRRIKGLDPQINKRQRKKAKTKAELKEMQQYKLSCSARKR